MFYYPSFLHNLHNYRDEDRENDYEFYWKIYRGKCKKFSKLLEFGKLLKVLKGSGSTSKHLEFVWFIYKILERLRNIWVEIKICSWEFEWMLFCSSFVIHNESKNYSPPKYIDLIELNKKLLYLLFYLLLICCIYFFIFDKLLRYLMTLFWLLLCFFPLLNFGLNIQNTLVMLAIFYFSPVKKIRYPL